MLLKWEQNNIELFNECYLRQFTKNSVMQIGTLDFFIYLHIGVISLAIK